MSRTVEPFVETFQMAVIATAIGCAVALPVAFLASHITNPNTPWAMLMRMSSSNLEQAMVIKEPVLI
jgi:ABC-type phosphate/phosphonate transport system permease subunit